MATKAKNTEVEQIVATAINAAMIVDRSNEGLHRALVSLVLTARRGMKWNIINAYVRSRPDWDSRKQGMVTASVLEWFKQVAKLNVDQEGSVSGMDAEEYGNEWAAQLREITWFKIARDLQVFKAPELEKLVATFAQGLAQVSYLGEEIDYEVMGEMVAKQVKAKKNSDAFKKWEEKAVLAAKKQGLDSVQALAIH